MRCLGLAFSPFALVVGLLATAPAHADPAYDKCMDKADTNRDFALCGSAMLDRREAELNRVWKEANKDIDPGVKAALLDEQRAWIVYKDKSCLTWTTGAFGREGEVIHYYTCRAAVIDARIAQLHDLGDDSEPAVSETPAKKGG